MCIQLSLKAQNECGSRKLKDFKEILKNDNYQSELAVIRNEVIGLASKFPLYN